MPNHPVPRLSTDTLKVQRASAKTRILVEKLRLFVSSMRFPERTPRAELAITLLMASMEHAEGVAFLMEHGPRYYGMPACALVRPQIECLLRGIFFNSADATHQEIVYFIENDQLPKRPDAEGKMRALSLAYLETLATEELGHISNQLSGSPLTRLFAFRPSELHGFVHGGAMLVKQYGISHASIGFNAPDNELLALLGSCGLAAGYAMTYIAARIATGPGEEPAALRAAHDAFLAEFLDRPQ